jgi:hypothetical protein
MIRLRCAFSSDTLLQIQPPLASGHGFPAWSSLGQPALDLRASSSGYADNQAPQHQKLKKNSRLSATITDIVMVAEDGRQRAFSGLGSGRGSGQP